MKKGPRSRELTRAVLRRMPLPKLSPDDDKEARGRALIIGGSTLVPGAILLSGVAALRAGAGKLQLATARAAADGLGLAVPEALVLPLPQNRAGEIAGARAASALRKHVKDTDAMLFGPGMATSPTVGALLAAISADINGDATVVLDGAGAIALASMRAKAKMLRGRAILTPHAGEMAALMDLDKEEVERDAANTALRAAAELDAIVALKGAETWIADPDGALLRFRGGSVGLGTSGSGDTLAGIVTGLAARGASPLTAAAWGVWAHGAAGRILARRVAAVGFLARELLAEVPRLVASGGR